jgi:hypothetical protein
MSIQKKSLINTLKSAKKANVVKDEVTVSGPTVSAAKASPRMVAARTSKVAPRVATRKAGARKVLRKAQGRGAHY